MSETPFIITVDTEGDNLWERPHQITTRNAAFLPRFQRLCERFGFKPVYLVNHEMAESDAFVEFGRDVAARGTGEIGMHLHAWNSPPLAPLTEDDFLHQPYLIEYPDPVMRAKIRAITRLLEDRFERKMLSHRAGRWALDGRYAAMLVEEGYLVDCSVTPGVDWRANRGAPGGSGGSNYTAFPERPYFVSPSDISTPATGTLLEVPMTVQPGRLFRHAPWIYGVPGVRRVVRKISPARRWLCPVALMEKHNLEAMVEVARRARTERPAHMEFMLHSSDLMPGGSPSFRSAADIDRLYARLEALFEDLSGWCKGMTLEEFRGWWMESRDLAGATGFAKREPDRATAVAARKLTAEDQGGMATG